MQARWSGIPISLRIFQFVVIHMVKGFGIINKVAADVFLELSCFFDDPMDVGNLISSSSAFSKSSLNIWKFSVHVLLKFGLENFEHYFASEWDECNCVVVWTFFGIAFLWDWNETDLFQSYGHCCSRFQLYVTLWTLACQAPLSILWFSRQEYTEELHKKHLHDPDNHDGVITHLEPDILECEVKWALGSITTNKASGGDGIPVQLFQIL